MWVYIHDFSSHLDLGGLKYIATCTMTLVVILTSVVSVCVYDFGGHIVTGMGWPRWPLYVAIKAMVNSIRLTLVVVVSEFNHNCQGPCMLRALLDQLFRSSVVVTDWLDSMVVYMRACLVLVSSPLAEF